MILVDDLHGLIHGATGSMIAGSALCGFPPFGNAGSDEPGSNVRAALLKGRPMPQGTLDDVTCPKCREKLGPA